MGDSQESSPTVPVMDDTPPMIPYARPRVADDELRRRAADLHAGLAQRRSVRMFATDPVPRDVVETCVKIAGTAPSGAHLQPWTWVLVGDPATKAAMREAAEAEERDFYATRATPEWLEALAPLGTDDVKTHLTDAPWVAVLFRHRYEVLPDGTRRKNYYSKESCGIAAGFLISALHQVGLATLTHTPSPMGFLRDLLDRPAHEDAELVLPIGWPAENAVVPDIERKPLAEILVVLDESTAGAENGV